jgi:hypothetical protein
MIITARPPDRSFPGTGQKRKLLFPRPCAPAPERRESDAARRSVASVHRGRCWRRPRRAAGPDDGRTVQQDAVHRPSRLPGRHVAPHPGPGEGYPRSRFRQCLECPSPGNAPHGQNRPSRSRQRRRSRGQPALPAAGAGAPGPVPLPAAPPRDNAPHPRTIAKQGRRPGLPHRLADTRNPAIWPGFVRVGEGDLWEFVTERSGGRVLLALVPIYA